MNAVTQDVSIDAGSVTLQGELTVPRDAKGVVLFAHGNGSSRFSPRNRFVARYLEEREQATLLLDLLSRDEEQVDERTGQFRFDVQRLGDRLVRAIDWLRESPSTARLPIALFGASTGAGAAMIAAAERPKEVCAVVSRGGRPDLAAEHLADVRAPVLLLVGSADRDVVGFNRVSLDSLPVTAELRLIAGATHLFEEPGALEQVGREAAQWFDQCFMHARVKEAAVEARLTVPRLFSLTKERSNDLRIEPEDPRRSRRPHRRDPPLHRRLPRLRDGVRRLQHRGHPRLGPRARRVRPKLPGLQRHLLARREIDEPSLALRRTLHRDVHRDLRGLRPRMRASPARALPPLRRGVRALRAGMQAPSEELGLCAAIAVRREDRRVRKLSARERAPQP